MLWLLKPERLVPVLTTREATVRAGALQQRETPALCKQRKASQGNEDPAQPKVNQFFFNVSDYIYYFF